MINTNKGSIENVIFPIKQVNLPPSSSISSLSLVQPFSNS